MTGQIVQAIKDSKTGQLFEDPAKYQEFLAKRASEETAVASEADRRMKLETLCSLVRDNMTLPSQFHALIQQTYEGIVDVINANPRKRKRQKALKLCKVHTKLRRLQYVAPGEAKLQAYVALTFNRDIDDSELLGLRGLGPGYVLKGFESNGGGANCNDSGEYVVSYDISAKLSQLPKFKQSVIALNKLNAAQIQHESMVKAAAEKAWSKDKELLQAQSAMAEANELYEAAREKYEALIRKARKPFDEAHARVSTRKQVVEASVEQKNAFKPQSKLDELKEGFGELFETSLIAWADPL